MKNIPNEYDEGVEVEHIPVTSEATLKRNLKYILSITLTQKQVPKSVKLTLIDLEWRVAMQEEYDALMRNGTWELIPRSITNNIINNI